MSLIAYFEFIKIPVRFYKTVGQETLQPDPNHWIQSKLLKILLYLGVLNYNVQWVFQVVFFVLVVQTATMAEANAVAAVTIFGFVGYMKQITLILNKSAIRGILVELEGIFPNSITLQKDYRLKDNLKTLKPVMVIFATLCLTNTFYFGLLPIFKGIIDVLFKGAQYEYPLGFPIWYPYDTKKNWLVYILTYSTQMYAAYMTGVSFLTADLFLVSSVTQLCFHFEYVAKKLDAFEPTTDEENHGFLTEMINRHQKCLNLRESVDTVFGFSLLLNFLASSGTICFVGFQMISVPAHEIIRYGVLLVTSLAQVMIICIYGNKLMDTSKAVGEAAFSHPWYNCDLSYQKKILLMICRSQKFAAIHAPTFPPISLATFMKVISMSYQFFAVLQTTNNKQNSS